MNSRPYQTLAAVTLLILAMGGSLIVSSCGRGGSSTDIIPMRDVNTYITRGDLEKGARKSLNSMPGVSIPHAAHEAKKIACAECHHKAHNEERIKQCVFCHKGMAGSTLYHGFCIGCHRRMDQGPEKCAGCHKGKISYYVEPSLKKQYSGKEIYTGSFHKGHAGNGVECVTCHHKDGKEGKRDGIQTCAACHVGTSRVKIIHAFCRNCHQEMKNGPTKCRECHRSAKPFAVEDRIVLPKTGHEKPAILFNHRAHYEEYHAECSDCHHTLEFNKCSSTGCHESRDQGTIINLKAAFHQQCHDCHRKTAGPKACGRCHIQKKGE